MARRAARILPILCAVLAVTALSSLLAAAEWPGPALTGATRTMLPLSSWPAIPRLGGGVTVGLTQFDIEAFPAVEVNARVTDAQGRAVTGLGAPDFALVEDGVEQQISSLQELRGETELNIALVIDTGPSMTAEVLTKGVTIAGIAGGTPVHVPMEPGPEDRLAWSPDGAQFAFSSSVDENLDIYVVDADGTNRTRLTTDPHDDRCPAWSPDGAQIAFQRFSGFDPFSGAWRVWAMNADGTGARQLPKGGAWSSDGNVFPAWSPDGSQIAFHLTSWSGPRQVYVTNADGSGTPVRLSDGSANDMAPAWSPDGTKIAFCSDRDGNSEIYVMDADGTDPVRLTHNPAADGFPAWSPDGSSIAFESDRDGNPEIYVMDADGTDQRNISQDPGADTSPNWSADSQEVAYVGELTVRGIDDAKAAAKAFLDVMGAGERVCVVGFGGQAVVAQTLTADTNAARAAVDGLRGGNRTALLEGVSAGLEQLSGVGGAGAVVLLASGTLTPSGRTSSGLIDYARALGVPIYAVAFGPDADPERYLRPLAEGTGGYVAPTAERADLESIYQDVVRRLSRYEITYTTTNAADDENYRTVLLTATTPGGAGSGTGWYRSPFVKLLVEIIGRNQVRPGEQANLTVACTNAGNVVVPLVTVNVAVSPHSGQVASQAHPVSEHARQAFPPVGPLGPGQTGTWPFPWYPPAIECFQVKADAVPEAEEPDVREWDCAKLRAALATLKASLAEVEAEIRRLRYEIDLLELQLQDPDLTDWEREELERQLHQKKSELGEALEKRNRLQQAIDILVAIIEEKCQGGQSEATRGEARRVSNRARAAGEATAAATSIPIGPGTSGGTVVCVVTSIDPNDKSGPSGLGPERFILSDGRVLHYTVYFENLPSATAEALEVLVRDRLDSDLDWSTFRFEGSSHPNCLTTAFNPSTGVARWRFVGINLPPNKEPPEGEGWVTYSVRLKDGLATGTQITNKATIVFDQNDPMDTPVWVNTVDAAAAESEIHPLPRAVPTEFIVEWIGHDEPDGSGVASYDIYVSDNGQPYALWLAGIAQSWAQFKGEVGHTYRFYSVARDGVGNVEAAPDRPDTRTTAGAAVWRHPAGLAMVSLPLKPAEPDPRQLGFDGDAWARWDPEVGEYVSYGSDPQRFTWFDDPRAVPGKGYWGKFAARENVLVIGPAPATGRAYAIPLRPGSGSGWVQIGCPRMGDIPWTVGGANALRVKRGTDQKTLAEAQAAGWCEDFAWGYAPGVGYELVYDPSVSAVAQRDRLEPWQGYWFLAHKPCQLIIPPAADLPTGEEARPRATDAGDGWQIALEAVGSRGLSSRVVIGEARPARQIDAPPPFQGAVQVAAVRGKRRLAIDLQPAGRRAWTLEVKTQPAREKVALRWPDLSALPHDVCPLLVDQTTGKRLYMRTSQGYTYRPDTDDGVRRFRVEVGSETSTLSVLGLAAVAADDGGIDVRLNLSASAVVDIDVLNLAGRRVATIARHRSYDGGQRSVSWGGRGRGGTRLPSGAYLIRVTARSADGQQVSGVTALSLQR
jgi:Tol biopolymer transport system component